MQPHGLLKEITALSDAYSSGVIGVDLYYELCGILIRLYTLERKYEVDSMHQS